MFVKSGGSTKYSFYLPESTELPHPIGNSVLVKRCEQSVKLVPTSKGHYHKDFLIVSVPLGHADPHQEKCVGRGKVARNCR